MLKCLLFLFLSVRTLIRIVEKELKELPPNSIQSERLREKNRLSIFQMVRISKKEITPTK